MPLYIVDTWREQFSLPGKQATVYDTLEAAQKVAGPLNKSVMTVFTDEDCSKSNKFVLSSIEKSLHLEIKKLERDL